jgi:hypothetical protein
MTSRTRRSFVRLCCAGAAAGILGTTGSVGAAAATPDPDDLKREQARFIAKFASKGEWAFGELKPVFDPPTGEELGEQFLEALVPSVTDLLPGFVGQAIQLKEQIEWYESLGEDSGFYFVSETGCIEFGEATPTGSGGDGLQQAKSEVETLVGDFADVEDRARDCVDDPSTENVDGLTAAMETLTDTLDGLEWVDRWSNVDPGAYQGRHPKSPQSAGRLQGNAQSVLDLASEFSDMVGDQRTAIRDEEYQPFPSALATYDASVDDIRSNVPLFDSIIAGDSYNVRTENGDGERVTVRYVDTGSSGEIADYELESGDSVDADVVLDERTFSEITEADDSMATAVDAYQSGDVQVDPNGFGNVIKYKTLPQLISALSGLF